MIRYFRFALLLLAFNAFVSLAKASSAGPDAPKLKGSLVLKSMPLSPILNRKITTWVYLPPDYNSPANANKRYPVVYLLHGQPGGWTDAYRSGKVEEMADALIDSKQIQPMILVAFDGDGPQGADDLTNFCNRQDGYRIEDFITTELVSYVDTTYRTIATPTARAIWGYSSGGYGALNLGFKYPNLWRVLCSHAGFYSPEDDAKVMLKVLGPRGERWAQNTPLLTVNNLPKDLHLHVYMDASPNEDDYDGFQTLTAKLQARGDDLETHSLPKAHAWKLIVSRCRNSLLFINKSWGDLTAR